MAGKPLGDITPVSPLDYEAEDDASSVQSSLSQQVCGFPELATCRLCLSSSDLEIAAKLVSLMMMMMKKHCVRPSQFWSWPMRA